MNDYGGMFTLLGMSGIMKEIIWGIMCAKEYLCYRRRSRGWGSEEHSWPLRRETIEIFYTYSFMSNFQGKKITKKARSNGNLEFVVW